MKTLTALFTVVVLTVMSATAFGATSDTLLKHAPADSQILIGMDVPKVKSSVVFQEVLKLVRAQAGSSPVVQFVLDEDGLDLENDVDSALLAFDRAPVDPQNPQAPDSVVVVTGKFNQAEVEAAAAEKFGKLSAKKVGELEVKASSEIALAFIDQKTLVVAGTDAFAEKAWTAANNPKKSAAANKDVKALMSLANTKLGLWLTMVTKGLAQPGAPPMDGAAMSGNLAKGVAVAVYTQFGKSDDAKAALAQFEQLKKQSGSDPMLAMFGAKPLIDNLEAKVEKERVLAMTTSMNDAQLRMMIERVKAMNQAPPPVAPPTKGQQSTPKAQPKPPGTGSNADFN